MQPKTVMTALGILSMVAVSAPRAARAADPLERFTAFAVDTSELAGRTRAGTIEIAIERWSSPEEQRNLQAALKEGGADALLRALQKVDERVGFIRSAGSIGYPLRFAHQVPQAGGGRRVIVATDRPIGFLESRNRPRTIDYPFMIVDIRMKPDGEGEGKLLPLAKITANDDHVIEVENYASVPVRLTKVRTEKP
jgi:hypothetical protein